VYRLRMPAEIGAWLTELAGSRPEAAAEVGAALAALMTADCIPDGPLVADPGAAPPVPADARELLDFQFQQLLEEAQHLQRELAEAEHERERTSRLLAAADPATELHPYLERRMAAAEQLCEALRRRAERVQSHVDAFRTRKETAKAIVTAAAAGLRAREALQAAGMDPAEGEAAGDLAVRLELARAEAVRLAGTGNRAAARPESDVFELSPDPLASGVRILFAEEPTGTITLLTALEDAAASDAHRDTAIDIACELLQEIRDEGWPTESLGFDTADTLIERFFPGRGADLVRRAAALGRATSLGRLRKAAGLTATTLAERGGLSHDTIGRIDRHGARHADAGDLAAYARALGGTLRLTVDLDGREHTIL